ncbi:MAG: argininosuccinate lyase [Marinovum sp.]|nr:argininosuccinate lyase [Marinovum sp.]MBT7907162.1 argininosuccinate lyase [Marinovum sp.]
MNSDYDSFPAQVYADSVLAPDLDIYKQHFSAPLHAINLAHGVMLAEQHLLQPADSAAILAALLKIDKDRPWADQEFDGSFEDLFFLIERALGRQVGEETAGRLHTGRSRNDMEHTMFRMQLRGRLLRLLEQYGTLADRFLARAGQGIDETVLLYTHGQPAQVSVLGHYLGAAIEFILRDMARLMVALEDVNSCPMGAAAITTSGFDLDRERVAALLGFSGIVENSYGAIANVDYITASYASIRLGCIHLGRLVQDLVTWTGFEVSQIDVADGFVQISSIMPQKRNPVPLEHLRLKFSLAAGGAEQIVQTMHNTPFADMNDSERETQAAGFEVFERLDHALPLLGSFVEAMKTNRASIENRIQKSMATITELADTLVRAEGIGFRAAHHVASKLAREALARRIGFDELTWDLFARTFEELVGRPPQVERDVLASATSPENFVAVREMPGGPGPYVLREALTGYADRLAGLKAEAEDIRKRIAQADALRNRLVSDVIAGEA